MINRWDILRKGKHNIETYGWVQHKSGSPEVGFCATGAALQEVTYKVFPKGSTAYKNIPYGAQQIEWAHAMELLAKAAGTNPSCITTWNDYKQRTKEEVLAAYELALSWEPVEEEQHEEERELVPA